MAKKSLTGKIIKTKTDFIATVSIERLVTHSKYHKKYTISKKFLVHNPENKFKLGQTVKITETKPMSKKIHFIIDTTKKKENKWFSFALD